MREFGNEWQSDGQQEGNLMSNRNVNDDFKMLIMDHGSSQTISPKSSRRKNLRKKNCLGRSCVHALMIALSFLSAQTALSAPGAKRVVLNVGPNDVIPTGNEWIALPAIRASDGAIEAFNVISMRDRGLLQVTGEQGSPAIAPYFLVGDKRFTFHNPKWELIEYWIPTATQTVDDIKASITYCVPAGSRGAILRMTLTNHGSKAVPVTIGLKASWGNLSRITYTPVELKGQRTMVPAPWAKNTQVFPYITDDTRFAWSLSYRDSQVTLLAPPYHLAPGLDARRTSTLEPGQTLEAHYVIGVGIEEYSASQSNAALEEWIDRAGVDRVVDDAAVWCRARTRTTGRADLDLLMNRNFLFTALYAWGRSIDTEQLVGVTSRSDRYYVSAAYWDRDAMIWSFPALLDIDPALAREALEYALTIQLRNTGTHSRFIDGTVLEDGLELDEVVAPVIALGAYIKRTGDYSLLVSYGPVLAKVSSLLRSQYDAETGLYTTLQDAQDEYRKQQFSTYDNVLVWKAMREMAAFADYLKDAKTAREISIQAEELQKAILEHCVATAAPGVQGPILVSATDGKSPIFADVPPGSLMKLPALEFIPETDPLFVRTYDWLHSKNYEYSNYGRTFGLPGSYRVPFTTPWEIADHLLLQAGEQQALRILLASPWDGGIITEGVDPDSSQVDLAGRAFATAAGYVSHMICQRFCIAPED